MQLCCLIFSPSEQKHINQRGLSISKDTLHICTSTELLHQPAINWSMAALHLLRKACMSRLAAVQLLKIALWRCSVIMATYRSRMQSQMATPVLLVALSISAPAMLYEPVPGSVKRRRHLPAWLGLLHAASIAGAVVGARFALFDAQSWLSGRHPSEGLLIGALLAGVAGGCIPLVMRFYGGSKAVRRALLLVGVLGAVLLLLQPPLPLQVRAISMCLTCSVIKPWTFTACFVWCSESIMPGTILPMLSVAAAVKWKV